MRSRYLSFDDFKRSLHIISLNYEKNTINKRLNKILVII